LKCLQLMSDKYPDFCSLSRSVLLPCIPMAAAVEFRKESPFYSRSVSYAPTNPTDISVYTSFSCSNNSNVDATQRKAEIPYNDLTDACGLMLQDLSSRFAWLVLTDRSLSYTSFVLHVPTCTPYRYISPALLQRCLLWHVHGKFQQTTVRSFQVDVRDQVTRHTIQPTIRPAVTN
jgi:hypothetical protein